MIIELLELIVAIIELFFIIIKLIVVIIANIVLFKVVKNSRNEKEPLINLKDSTEKEKEHYIKGFITGGLSIIVIWALFIIF